MLATVALSIQEFMVLRPEATVFFTGSTDQRTQVYGWAIAKYWQDIASDFFVEGITETGDVVSFVPGKDYIGFLIRK